MANFVTITHRGETAVAPAGEWQGVADDMVKRLGAWVPGESSVVPVDTSTTPHPTLPCDERCDDMNGYHTETDVAPAPTPAPRVNSDRGLVHDADAAARIEAQHEALRSAGVEGVGRQHQFFDTGTRMMDVGYDTQRQRVREHAEKLPARDAAASLVDRIVAEQRRDVTVKARDFAAGLSINGALRFDGLKVREQAIRGLLARIDSRALSYVLSLRDRIAPTCEDATDDTRAADKAALLDVLQRECKRFGDVPVVLRTRRGLGDIFAAVSEGYAAADAPDVLPDVIAALPDDARASVSYDPESTAWELRASVFTPTPVDEQAVGEAFEGYVAFSSRDNGTRRLGGGGGILLLRCLNASTYEAASRDASRVHRGRILYDVKAMAEAASGAIHALCAAWGTARTDELEAPRLVPIEDVIPGFYRHMLTQRKGELVGVLPGRREERVAGLAMAYTSERRDTLRIVRSDLAQGWTRYVQDEAPGVQRDAERAIGRWLVSSERVAFAAA